ncbi:NACHT domain-containing NTPase [Streptomyces sp. RKAG293]|uniref:NACHT domain-containing protein n=1 Tax=Streptomyces sp. RKAG293 TaxID=2893403 RepID=UPI00203362C2|nr:NACHT domain-containing protein [Streptomyces sp. RKAG293]MCM2419310.1 NACHT domain-containing protein [Streptomyces sp. RKAG293]
MLLQSAAANYTTLFTMFGAITAALIAGAGLLYQIRRTRALERDKATWTADLEKQKVQHQLDVDLEVKRRTWNHEQETAERERRRAEAEAERERERAAQLEATVHRDLELGAAEYCEKLAHELSMLRILDLSRPLDLKKLYVQVRVQEQEPLRFLNDAEVEALFPHLMPQLVQDVLGDSAGAPRRPLRAAPVTLAPMEALQRHQRIIVVGDPGAGKTTMLRHLAFVMASRRGTAGTPDLPAYVELNHFMASEHTDLLDYLAEFWADRYGFANSRAHLEAKLTDGTAALLLDGLDEVLGGGSTEEATAAYNNVVREVNRLAARFPRALVAVTCRRHGWRGGLQPFQVMEALDFEWPQIKTFIANWFGAKDGRTGALMHALSGNSRLQTLAANPLLLSLIAIVYERDLELPERRAALYRRCVEVMLREWDAHRQISRYSRFTTDNKQDLLKQIAWHYHRLGRRYFAEDDLLTLIADYLPTIDLPRGDNRAILDEIAAQYGLLKAQAHGWYGFLHLTLQEHFAATALWERGPEGIELATAMRYDPWWEEVILLLAGSLPDATPLLLGLLQLPPDGSGREGDVLDLPDDDLFHTDLLMAGSCLTGSPRIADARLRQQIVRSLWRLCETTPYWNERERAAQVLVALLGSGRQLPEIIDYIANDRHRKTTRMALVNALGTLGGRGVGERLLGLLALRPDLSLELRQQIVWALGRLRVAGAVPTILRELAVQLALPDAPLTGPSSVEVLRTVVEALGATGGPADTLLLLLGQEAESTTATSLVKAVGHALVQLDDPAVPDLILRHAERRGRWSLGFGGVTLAGSYLEIVGEPGFRALLDTVLTGLPSESEAALILWNLADFVTRGHGRSGRDDLLTLARDGSRSWEVRWLAMECLEHLPGNPADLASLVSHTDRHVAVSAAITLAAWGALDHLSLVQEAILAHDLTAALGFFSGPGDYWTRPITDRVSRALTAYHDPEFSRRLARSVPEDEDHASSKSRWLAEFNPEATFDRHLRRLTGPVANQMDVYAPWELPRSRVPAALSGIRALRSQPDTIRSPATSRLLSAISEVGDDTETVVGLLSLADLFGSLPHFVDQGNGANETYHGLHRALYMVSRRARVRVLKDGTVVPITSA